MNTEKNFDLPTAVGNGIYQKCYKCGQIVKINKFIFGSMHVCAKKEGQP